MTLALRMFPKENKSPFNEWNVEIMLNGTTNMIRLLTFEQAQNILSVVEKVHSEAVNKTKERVLIDISEMVEQYK